MSKSGGLSGSEDSGGSGDSQESGAEVTPQVLDDIARIVDEYKNEQCVQCANEIEKYLRRQNIRGRRIKLDTTKLVREDNFIIDDSLPPGSDAIATNGHHEGVEITVNGEKRVFDNHHRDPVLTEQWMNNLTFYSKEYGGASFRESGYIF